MAASKQHIQGGIAEIVGLTAGNSGGSSVAYNGSGKAWRGRRAVTQKCLYQKKRGADSTIKAEISCPSRRSNNPSKEYISTSLR